MKILKRDGRLETFDFQKIIATLKRSGFPEDEAREIAEEVAQEAFDGIKSRQLLKIVKRKIRQRKPVLASRYDLKRALFALGPAGYSFEDFLAHLFAKLGYLVQVRQMIKGECAWHEVDLVIEKDGRKAMVEAKFRTNGKGKVEIKEALYTYARLIDLKKAGFEQGYLVTNARFTTEVISYAECCGLELLSWDYPAEASLAQLIDRNKLYPVTLLPGLNSWIKKGLLEIGVVLAEELVELDPQLLRAKGLNEEEIAKLKKLSQKILNQNH